MPRPAAIKAVVDDEPDQPASSGRIVTLDYDGHTYTFDADEVTLDALEDFENQRYIRAIRGVLGDDQWAAYKSHHPKAVDLNRFVAALVEALGNSSASPAS